MMFILSAEVLQKMVENYCVEKNDQKNEMVKVGLIVSALS